MSDDTFNQLASLASHLSSRHDAILEDVWACALQESGSTSANSLTRAQFRDDLPRVLTAFEERLTSRRGGSAAEIAKADSRVSEMTHGLERWRHGYRLRELLREWGYLLARLHREIRAFASAHQDFNREAVDQANTTLIEFINEAVAESADEYSRLQQDEAASYARDVQTALQTLKEADQRRAVLVHQAVHDLRGSVQSVTSAADALRESDLSDNERQQFVESLTESLSLLSNTLEELLTLARIDAGQEQRRIAPFDAGELATEFSRLHRTVARQRGLALDQAGPSSLPVTGDAHKVRRILQNLVLNSLKYTRAGGVKISWGALDQRRWWLEVTDTGPGMKISARVPLLGNLTPAQRDRPPSEPPPRGPQSEPEAPKPQAPQSGRGEGVGLLIVKRLCDLLDAALEFASSEHGTTFRVVFPSTYPKVGGS